MKQGTPNAKEGRERAGLLAGLMNGSIRFFLVSILCTAAVSAMEMIIPDLIRMTVDSVIGTQPLQLPGYLNAVTDVLRIRPEVLLETCRKQLWLIAAAITAIAACIALFRYGSMLSNTAGSETLTQRMRNRLYSHLQKLPSAWHSDNHTGDIIQRCTSDVDTISNFVSMQLISVFSVVLMISFSLVFMFSMSVRLSLIAAATIPLIIAYSIYFHSKIEKLFFMVDENEGALSAIAQENLTGVRVVRAFGRESYEMERFNEKNRSFAALAVRMSKLTAIFWGTGDLISGLQIMAIVIFGVVFTVGGDMTTGELIAFISYNAMLTMPVRELGRVISEMSKAGVSLSRVGHILNSAQETDKPDAGTANMHGDIEFTHVSFSYDGTANILDDVSFKIPAGSVFGILGGTGSGKTTLMHLLGRLYDLGEDCGKITVGGVGLADRKASWVRANIGMALQEPFLFEGTIAENIGIAQRQPEIDAIRTAAEIACIDESIAGFAKGYETIVGERGVTLSGGQKQRMAIARMPMDDKPILVFDDSLSAVDAETDAKIRAALASRFVGKTVILISHRITTLMNADQILVLDKGKVAELGNHSELLQKGGIYQRIYEIQSMSEEAEA